VATPGAAETSGGRRRRGDRPGRGQRAWVGRAAREGQTADRADLPAQPALLLPALRLPGVHDKGCTGSSCDVAVRQAIYVRGGGI